MLLSIYKFTTKLTSLNESYFLVDLLEDLELVSDCQEIITGELVNLFYPTH